MANLNLTEQTGISAVYKTAMDNFDKEQDDLLNVAYSENSDEVMAGMEAFALLDKVFYKVDKALQKGIKGTINYFSTVNVYIDDINEYSTKTPNITTMVKLQKNLLKHIENDGKFYKISNKKAPVILGMKVTLADILKILETNVGYVNGLEDSMVEFNQILEDVINSKKDSINIHIDKTHLKAINKHINLINNDMATVTDTKVLSDRKPVKDIVSNFKELDNIVTASLKLGKTYNMERLENIYDINEQLVLKLDVIYNSIKNNNTNMDKHNLKDFIAYINTIAKYLTAIAFLFYLYYQLLNMLSAVIKITELTKEDNTVLDSISLQIKKGTRGIEKFVKQLVG